MMHKIFGEINEKYGEWIDMAGANAPVLIVNLLCQMIEKEREKTEYYKKLFESGVTCQR